VRIPTEPRRRTAAWRSCRTVLAASGIALALSSPRAASADATSDLEKAHGAYVAHKYDEAETRLRALLDPKSPGSLKDPDGIADARMYLAAALLAAGKQAEAQAVLEKLLLDKPDYQPDPLRVSLQATDALVDARARLREILGRLQAERVRQAQEEKAKAEAERQKAAQRLQMLEKLAGEELVVYPHSRWVAILPFGVGQFQNGQDAAGWLFLSAESLLALGSVVGGAFMLYDEGQATDALKRHDITTASAYNQRAQLAALVGDTFAAGFAVVAVAGIAHAQFTFVPERTEIRRRALPALALSFAPWMAPGAAGREGGAGGIVGLHGTF
jgi:tetratricopeptide (TPR) repeat protein